ncbi:uncharacterized protein LOC142333100 isoform X2 [Lycorma delicatula]|uniref:uncharacterized protein LOC142333100 isoform X2 n=1 Tax=Lycorma delicatula TaxID=130591 RepID=UPI003F5105DC
MGRLDNTRFQRLASDFSATKFSNKKGTLSIHSQPTSIFTSIAYIHHEKYPNLQASCQTFEKKSRLENYIKRIYKDIMASYLPENFRKTEVYELIEQILLTMFENYQVENKLQFLPTLLHLLDAIPDAIIIKGGIINTGLNSIVSGIDITETISNKSTDNYTHPYKDISTSLPCNPKAPQTSIYGDVEYVIMDDTYIYAYYKCGKLMQKMKFQLSDEETEKEIIKKIDIQCTLRLRSKEMMKDFFKQLTPIFNIDEERLKENKLQFELKFSYICKFISPLQVFLNKNIFQYKILNFTVSGYQFIKPTSSKPECLGLTYCLQHQNIRTYETNLEEYFLYKF